ncbi:hypothetical protein EYF80_038780 [Liparis tanakae]|uniref:Uncharacterized protein n=1 Tax=Liparis tanakae TaxID=230148 RepID=A0A4Z2GBL6_9TELE|nr:hypothetical protein EYF80_038780 [Liparis tanakae]
MDFLCVLVDVWENPNILRVPTATGGPSSRGEIVRDRQKLKSSPEASEVVEVVEVVEAVEVVEVVEVAL